MWNAENGERYKLSGSERITLDPGPAELKLFVFDKEKKGPVYNPVIKQNAAAKPMNGAWMVEGKHMDGSTIQKEMNELKDLKDVAEWLKFAGTITYRNNFTVDDKTKIQYADLGKVFGISELFINGMSAGVKWYGRRIYPVADLLKIGDNEILIKIVTTMGNYMKSLTDNKIAQYWTNEGRKIQPLEPTGLLGPVIYY
jgi:hypothetical protein